MTAFPVFASRYKKLLLVIGIQADFSQALYLGRFGDICLLDLEWADVRRNVRGNMEIIACEMSTGLHARRGYHTAVIWGIEMKIGLAICITTQSQFYFCKVTKLLSSLNHVRKLRIPNSLLNSLVIS